MTNQDTSSPEGASQAQPTILIVDDVVQNIEVVGIMLRGQNIKVIGATGAEHMFRILENRTPDLILLDVQMPGVDGFEACQTLKANPATQEIPVIFLTAKTETADLLRGFQSGAVDYITKPFQPSELFARVKTHLELKDLRDAVIQQNLELQNANEQLRQLNLEKNEFLGIVAHDLKNPLSAIVLAADAVEMYIDGISKEEIIKRLDQMRSSALYMRDIVSNLLDVNALESGSLTFATETFDISNIAHNVVENFQERAVAKNITLNLEPLPEQGVAVYADPLRVTETLENLVSNAVKYSPPDKNVWVSASAGTSAASGESVCLLCVRDEGPGLSEEDLSKLFGKFARLSAQPTGGEHSTGLGLSIVKKLTEAMGGRVWCESELGKGAAFYAELPLGKS